MLLQNLRQNKPLIHCITNQVVANFQANGLLALGASPIMADAEEETAEIAALSSCCVFNFGTIQSHTIPAILKAGKRAMALQLPIVIDPVGVGASSFRKQTIEDVLAELKVTLIRGNAGELATLADVAWEAKGVDAGEGSADLEEVARIVAKKYHCLVALTGEQDLLTDGERIVQITGGHKWMERVTGVGCLLTAVCGAFIACQPDHPFHATRVALTYYKLVGEQAAAKASGIGDFAVQFLNVMNDLQDAHLPMIMEESR